MIWQNPWAWAGLLSLALPVAIHLLSRGHARLHRFPSLRFVAPSRLLPTRRTTLRELLLLATRLAILAAAVAALAQPLLDSAGRKRVLAHLLARAIIVDTSASMNRQTPQGIRAVDAARTAARRLAAEAQSSVVSFTATPATFGGTIPWLERQPGRRELVVISDMQLGAITATDLAAVPSSVGVRLVRIELMGSDSIFEARASRTGGVVVARTSASGETTWRGTLVGDGTSILVVAGPAEQKAVDAAMRAARSMGVRLPTDSNRAIEVVLPQAERREGFSAPRTQWMMDAVVRLRGDSVLLAAAARARVASAGDSLAGVVVVHDAAGAPLVVAAQGIREDRLVLFSRADAGSLATAALIAAAERARSTAPPIEELEPGVVPDQTIAAWQRAPGPQAPPAADRRGAMSDGRWLWLVALALLALEYWLRSTRRDAVVVDSRTARDRAA